MNFLAHAYLSFSQDHILVGNMISDFVKGRKQYQYPDSIQKGIRLHRAIDAFTDNHPATQIIRTLFKPVYGLYALPLADVAYDYFLAADEQIFPTSHRLEKFTHQTYATLEAHHTLLPSNFQRIFHYMRTGNWLLQYRTNAGIADAFRGLVRRARYMNDAEPAIEIFEQNSKIMREAYINFFPDVTAFARNILNDEKEGEYYL